MRSFLLLSALVTVAMARVLQVSPLPNLQAYASASASTATSSPQQVSLLRLLPNARLTSDGRVLDTLEVNLASQQRQAVQQHSLVNENVGFGLRLSPQVLSTSASPSVAPLAADGRVLDTLEVRLAKAAHAAAHRDEQLRLASQNAQAAQAQAQQQQSAGNLISSTRLAQSLASVSPTGASTSSTVQLLESPELSAFRAQQQQQLVAGLQQNLLLTRESGRPLSNGLPLLVGADGHLVASPFIYL